MDDEPRELSRTPDRGERSSGWVWRADPASRKETDGWAGEPGKGRKESRADDDVHVGVPPSLVSAIAHDRQSHRPNLAVERCVRDRDGDRLKQSNVLNHQLTKGNPPGPVPRDDQRRISSEQPSFLSLPRRGLVPHVVIVQALLGRLEALPPQAATMPWMLLQPIVQPPSCRRLAQRSRRRYKGNKHRAEGSADPIRSRGRTEH